MKHPFVWKVVEYGLTVAALSVTVRANAPRVLTSRHATQRVLTETLASSYEQQYGKYYYAVPHATDTLLQLLSGELYSKGDTVIINDLLQTIGIEHLDRDGAESVPLSKPFYQALFAVYSEFHPEVVLSKSPKYSERKDVRANYDFRTHSVSFFPQAFKDLQEQGLHGKELQYELQRMLVIRLVAELAHAAQHKNGNLYGCTIRDKVRENILGGTPWEALYKKEESMEYTAHHVIEPVLQKQFTQAFEDHMDRNNPADRKLLGDLLSGYRYRQEKNQKTQSSWYQDLHQAAEAYRMAQSLGCNESCNYLDELLCLYDIVPTGVYFNTINTSLGQSALSQRPGQ